MSSSVRQGENVKQYIETTSGNTAGGIAGTIRDANGQPRPLKSWERVVVDSVQIQCATGTGLASYFDPTVGTGTPICTCPDGQRAAIEFPNEGVDVTPGVTPVVTTASGILVIVIVSMRIINASRQPTPRPNWQALLTPGGNPGGV